MKLDPVTVAVLALAVYRVTVLVVSDYLCEPVRSLLRRWEMPSDEASLFYWDAWDELRGWQRRVGRHAAYLSSCPWCCSIWAAAALVPLTALVSWWVWIDAGLASSAVASVIFRRLNVVEEDS